MLVKRDWTAMDKHLQIAEETGPFNSVWLDVWITARNSNTQYITECYTFRPPA
jgi:hypothetical protein